MNYDRDETFTMIFRRFAELPRAFRRLLMRVHRDQQGAISIASVFALMLLAMLLGMVINTGVQADHKIRLQNAADASTYSAGVVLARGMNTLSFTNHLLCDVFAMTAYMREARDRSSESLTPDVLAAWKYVAPVFAASQIPKFSALGRAIDQKIPRERKLVHSFSEWAAAASELVLPTLEQILADRAIPRFQRALVVATPQLAQVAADQIAQEHGLGSQGPGSASARKFRAVLWRTNGDAAGGPSEADRRTLPVVDPVMDAGPEQQDYLAISRSQRRRIAHIYLRDWNNETLLAFDHEAKMSQFSNLWRGFTCGQLKRLLEVEYPYDNLLHVIRTQAKHMRNVNAHLERDYTFIGVAYSPKPPETLPGLFKNPLASDSQAFAQLMLFVPRPKLRWRSLDVSGEPNPANYGGVPGDIIEVLPANPNPGAPEGREWRSYVHRQMRPHQWDAMNQNWTVQLMPARSDSLITILRTPPRTPVLAGQGFETPRLRGVGPRDLRRVNQH